MPPVAVAGVVGVAGSAGAAQQSGNHKNKLK